MTHKTHKHDTGMPCAGKEDLCREVAYLRRLAEENAARLLQTDMQSVMIRHELEQKRRGFRLMAELALSLRQDVDSEGILVSTSRRLNAALNMQRTAVLVPDADGVFYPVVLQGYPASQRANVESRRFTLPPEMLDPASPILITAADDPGRLALVREGLGLPYLISCPVTSYDDVAAILVTGRVQEQQPFLPRLGKSDVDTIQTVSAYLAATMSGHRLREAENRANYDALTQLPNLRLTIERLRQALALARRWHYFAAVMFLDLDGFKQVNDRHGHPVGDVVLRIVAERLGHCLRESDLVGRIGGDEFVIVLSRIESPDDASLVASKIIARLAEPIDVQGDVCQVGASIGIALFPYHGQNETELLKAADDAMYRVKKKGKNSFSYALR